MSRWTDEQKELFNKHAGKIADDDLAKQLGRPLKEVLRRRRYMRIKSKEKSELKYSDEMRQFVRDNFRTMSNDEIAGKFNARYPDKIFTKHGIRGLIVELQLKRTEADIKYIKERCKELGVFKAASAKAAIKLRKHKVGELCFVHYSNKRRLCIRVAEGRNKKGQFRPYQIWLWEQANGPVSMGKQVLKINPLLPYSVDNLKLVSKYHKYNVGDLVTRMIAGVPRVHIKLSNTKFQLYEVYLWEKHYGPVPKGRIIKKIDPNGPIAIDNLFAAKPVALAVAMKELPDWYVKSTLRYKANLKHLITPDDIAIQRLKIEAQRALKSLLYGTASNSPGRYAADQQLAHPSAPNG